MGKLVLLDHFNHGDEQVALHGQVVGNILNFNEEQRKYSDENWQKADEDIKPVARIPRVIVMLWQQMGIMDDAGELGKALERNPEWKRTEKQVGEKPKQYFDLGRHVITPNSNIITLS